MMQKKYSCEDCVYYVYNEEEESYECENYLDEDEMGRVFSSKSFSCPYFRFGDDYQIVRKQN